MLFCGSCETHVAYDEMHTLRTYGECTRCRVRSLPPPTLPLPSTRTGSEIAEICGRVVEVDDVRPTCLTDEALVEARREAELERVVLIGIPSVEEQHAIVDVLDRRLSAAGMLPLHESLVWCAENGITN